MKNILIIDSPKLNTWYFAKLVSKFSNQIQTGIYVYNTMAIPQFPVLAGSYQPSAVELQHEDFEEFSPLVDKLNNVINNKYQKCESFFLKENVDFNFENLTKAISSKKINLIIMSKDDLYFGGKLKTDFVKQLNKIICPVLLIPEIGLIYPDKISYLTDLRYCTKEAVKFLKIFNGSIFVTHITAPGLTDIEPRYAQQLLAEFSESVSYKKLFLRNIKGQDKQHFLEVITGGAEINCMAIESNKHNLLEWFLPENEQSQFSYGKYPVMVLPYLNWIN